jgi:hypothetical protein
MVMSSTTSCARPPSHWLECDLRHKQAGHKPVIYLSLQVFNFSFPFASALPQLQHSVGNT